MEAYMHTLTVLEITDIRLGDGNLAVIGSCVKVKCVARFINECCLGSEEKSFVLEEGEEAAGLVEGILGMRVGGKRTIEAPARWWYGEDASPEDIPSNTGLVFEVELLNAFFPQFFPEAFSS
jgi:FKBP-type peptidyl-prolyl cis-trans isomerase